MKYRKLTKKEISAGYRHCFDIKDDGTLRIKHKKITLKNKLILSYVEFINPIGGWFFHHKKDLIYLGIAKFKIK